jgi:hypothetical protein
MAGHATKVTILPKPDSWVEVKITDAVFGRYPQGAKTGARARLTKSRRKVRGDASGYVPGGLGVGVWLERPFKTICRRGLSRR